MSTLTFPTPTTGNTRTDVCNAKWCSLYCDRQITDCSSAYVRRSEIHNLTGRLGSISAIAETLNDHQACRHNRPRSIVTDCHNNYVAAQHLLGKMKPVSSISPPRMDLSPPSAGFFLPAIWPDFPKHIATAPLSKLPLEHRIQQ